MSKVKTKASELPENLQLNDLDKKADLLIEGLDIAKHGNKQTRIWITLNIFPGTSLVNSVLTFFTKFDQPMTKSALISISEILIEIKRIENVLRKFSQLITTVY